MSIYFKNQVFFVVKKFNYWLIIGNYQNDYSELFKKKHNLFIYKKIHPTFIFLQINNIDKY